MPLNKEFVRKQLNKADVMLQIAYEEDDLDIIFAAEVYRFYWIGTAGAGKLVRSEVIEPTCTNAAATKVSMYKIMTGRFQ